MCIFTKFILMYVCMYIYTQYLKNKIPFSNKCLQGQILKRFFLLSFLFYPVLPYPPKHLLE